MLDKQYSRVIRWIHRAQIMSADGNFSDAILDVECARAELDDARQELLLCHQTGNLRRSVRTCFMILPTALVTVLFLASPLRISEFEKPMVSSQMQRAGTEAPQKDLSAPLAAKMEVSRYNEWLTADEKEILDLVRNSAPSAQSDGSSPSVNKRSLIDGRVHVIETKKAVRSRPSMSRLSDADMYRLMEVGRKALHKSNNSVVLEFN